MDPRFQFAFWSALVQQEALDVISDEVTFWADVVKSEFPRETTHAIHN
jgi:hypothetical protein